MCNFSIDFSGPAANVVQEARKAIENAGGSFNGDTNEGDFEIQSPVGKARGTYTISNSAINIVITKKPIIISCARIEEELRKRLGVSNE
jgi:hypothetical protein